MRDPVAWNGMRGWDVILFCPGKTWELAQSNREGDVQTIPDEVNPAGDATRDLADVPAVEVITTTAVHLMSAAAIQVGLSDDPRVRPDLDEARKLITALAGLITAGATEISDSHARPLRDGLRSLQLAFREASTIPDPIGQGPGEKWTGPVT